MTVYAIRACTHDGDFIYVQTSAHILLLVLVLLEVFALFIFVN